MTRRRGRGEHSRRYPDEKEDKRGSTWLWLTVDLGYLVIEQGADPATGNLIVTVKRKLLPINPIAAPTLVLSIDREGQLRRVGSGVA